MTDYSDLVKRLRGPIKHPQQLINSSKEAADAIEILERDIVLVTDAMVALTDRVHELNEENKRITELEAALKPFADEAQFFWPKALDKHLAAPPQLYLTIGEFRAARKVLGEKE